MARPSRMKRCGWVASGRSTARGSRNARAASMKDTRCLRAFGEALPIASGPVRERIALATTRTPLSRGGLGEPTRHARRAPLSSVTRPIVSADGGRCRAGHGCCPGRRRVLSGWPLDAVERDAMVLMLDGPNRPPRRARGSTGRRHRPRRRPGPSRWTGCSRPRAWRPQSSWMAPSYAWTKTARATGGTHRPGGRRCRHAGRCRSTRSTRGAEALDGTHGQRDRRGRRPKGGRHAMQGRSSYNAKTVFMQCKDGIHAMQDGIHAIQGR